MDKESYETLDDYIDIAEDILDDDDEDLFLDDIEDEDDE